MAERLPLLTYCRANKVPITLEAILGDGDVGVIDQLMTYLKETRLIREF